MAGYLLAAGLKGAADEYIKQGDEERAAKLQEIRDKRLSDLRVGERKAISSTIQAEATHTSGLRKDESTHTSSLRQDEATHQGTINENQAQSDYEREMKKPIAVSEGTDLVVADPDDRNAQAQSIYQNPKDFAAGTATGPGGIKPENASKFFKTAGNEKYGTYANNAYSFGDKKDAQNAARASALAEQLWVRSNGAYGLNNTFLFAYKAIEKNPSMSVERLQEELQEKQDEWIISDADKEMMSQLEAEIQQRIGNEFSLPNVQLGSDTPGDNAAPTAQPDAQAPTVNSKEELDALVQSGRIKSGDQYIWGPTGKPYRKK